MKNMYLKKWMVAASLLLATGSYAQNVKLVLNKGQKYEVSTTSKVNSVASVMGQEMESTANTLTVELIEVKDTRAAETDLVSTVTRLSVSSSAMGQEMNYDSDKKDNSGPGTEEMAKQVNKPRNITINDNGKILKEEKNEAAAGMMMMSGGGGNGLAFFREALIGKNLKTGESWADSTVNNTDKMKTTTVGTFTVKSIENNIATVTFAGTASSAGTMEQMGQEMEMKATNKINSESKVNLANGTIIENTTNVDGTATVEAMGMSIPVTIKNNSTTTVKAL